MICSKRLQSSRSYKALYVFALVLPMSVETRRSGWLSAFVGEFPSQSARNRWLSQQQDGFGGFYNGGTAHLGAPLARPRCPPLHHVSNEPRSRLSTGSKHVVEPQGISQLPTEHYIVTNYEYPVFTQNSGPPCHPGQQPSSEE